MKRMRERTKASGCNNRTSWRSSGDTRLGKNDKRGVIGENQQKKQKKKQTLKASNKVEE